MKISLAYEMQVFFFMMLSGIAEGLVFDIFRVARKNMSAGFSAVAVSDIIYWIFASVVFAFSLISLTDGMIRGYMLFGMALGIIFYFLLLSEWVNYIIMQLIKNFLTIFKLIFKILLTPLIFLYKMLLVHLFNFLKGISAKTKLKIISFKKMFFMRKLRKKNDKKEK